MRNAMQLKAIIRNIAKEKRISAQLVLQNYMLERFLERVSLSSYRDNYIIKGGFLIASMVGLDTRATMDMDATIKGMPVNPETVREMIEAILSVPVEDDVSFELKSIGNIRKDDIYGGFRAALTANYGKMAIPLKLDITIGDSITPKEIEYEYKLMLEDRSIRVLAYNLTTVLAEKLEAVISRSDQSTRLRDYYDIFILAKLEAQNINSDQLGLALRKTSERRGSFGTIMQYRKIIETVRNSEVMKQRWLDYQKDFEYAKGILFEDACDAVLAVMEKACGYKKPAEGSD
ncbi:MAG: nucleotidyl transferase AbiEii/AbiGii toxin family protein [Erysipelotrichaceae bacterium]|nr:nucleotidyl transferase AbiEii/AbiGii toxin family protein [Erysipelotrichaceae bacterium]